MTNFIIRNPNLQAISTNSAKTTLGILNNDSSFTVLTYGTTTTWNTNNSYKAKAVLTLTGNSLLSITNIISGSEGKLIVKQDSTGNRLLYLPSNSYGNITLNTNPNAVTVLEYYYDGTNYYWDTTYLNTYKALNITTNSIANNLKWLIYPLNNPLDMYGNKYNSINSGELTVNGLRNTTNNAFSGIYYKNKSLINTSTANFTISVRAKIAFNANISAIVVIPYIDDDYWLDPYACFYLSGNSNTQEIEFAFADTTGTLRGMYAFNFYSHDSAYKLITVVKNAGNLLLYINGSLIQTITGSNTTINFPSTAGDICIGSRERRNPAETSHLQQLDFAAIWFRALSATEISTLNSNIYSLIQ